jgi:HK97 family phage prohead protease
MTDTKTDKTLEIKADLAVTEAGEITGIAWPFGSADRYGDLITKGAFRTPETLPMLFAHDPHQPVGVWHEIKETMHGLEVRGRLLINDVEKAREVHALVKARAITGISIGFVTKDAKPRIGGGREIRSLNLHEISLVTVPAHPGARIVSAKDATAALAIAEAINRATSALQTPKGTLN